jgi:hypothetical protein
VLTGTGTTSFLMVGHNVGGNCPLHSPDKIMKNKDNVRILDHEPTTEDFTQHGLHLNAASKTKIAKLMSQNISPLSEIRKKHPIILKWNTNLNDPSTVNNISKVMNEEHVVIGNEGRAKTK